MKELREYIASVIEDELKGAKTSQERGEAYEIVAHITIYEENELEYLRQEDILDKLRRSPIVVPNEYWEDAEIGFKSVLTSKGEAWVRHELKKLSNTEIEFWFKLVVPVLALVLSVIALVKKSR